MGFTAVSSLLISIHIIFL